MANTRQILDLVKVDNELREVIAKSDGENVTVTYNGEEMTLSAALAQIATSVSDIPTKENVDTKISAAIDELIGGAPETYDTLKEISEYILNHEDVVTTLNTAIGNKVDKEEGKGLSAEDFTSALRAKLDALPAITAADVEKWNGKADNTAATTTTAGLMSAEDKKRLDGLRGVRYGTEPPEDMQNGELFIRVVSDT